MFVLILAVPALLLVVLGYVVGSGVWTGLGGPVGGAEPAGWSAGVLLLAVVVRLAVAAVRRRRRND